MLRKANVDTWRISKDANGKRLRDAAYVIPPKASESESESDSDPDDNIPLARMIKKHRQEIETSEDEDDIPLMELRKRLNYRELRQNKKEDIKVKDMEYDDEVSSDNSCTLPLSDLSTGQPRYVKLAYLEYKGYVEVIVHSRIFPIYCIVFRPCLCQTRLS